MANQVSVNTGSGAGAQQVIVDSNGNISVTVSRSVIGTVANVASANYANFAGEVVDPSQPNITSVGNLTSLNVTGTTTTGNLIVQGNLQVGNLVANTANYANFAGNAFAVAGANVVGAVANATYAVNAGSATTAGSANTATVANSANSVTLANVSGAGNIASINLDGSASNVLYGNGAFAPAATGNVANANYANFAGTAFSVNGSNVSGAVANATFATTAGSANTATVANSANSVAGANVSGTVANATFATTAGSATTAGTVTTNAQPNITSVGTLTNLAVTGNITANVINANYVNANINMANVDSIFFDTNVATTLTTAGQLAWEDGEGTLQLLMKGGNVTQTVGTQEYARVYNAEATTLNKGEVVYIFGAQGNRVSVKRAQANTEATSVGTIGLVAETIPAGAEGFVTVSGALYRINTNGLVAGAPVYLSPTVLGGFTTTKPVAPDQLVVLGWIERVSATVGSIYIKVDNGYELDELHNVLIANAVAGQALVYNSSNLWVNGNPEQANIANIAYSVDGANVSGAVANATFALDAGNANIANIAYSVDAANVSGLGNIATINLDGNASNFLDGTGNFVAAPSGANANYANFAGTVLTNAQPNITSVGTLTGLTVDANTPITISSTNGNLSFQANNISNIAGSRVEYVYRNPTSNLATVFGADETGIGMYMGNTASGNVGTGNIRSYWQFLPSGDFRHTLGGTGNLFAKNLLLGNFFTGVFNGNVFAGNVTANGGIFTGNAAGLTNIPGANVTGTVANANVAVVANSANSVTLANVSGAGNIASINLDGNASNLLDGTGNWVAIPTGGSSNYANFAGEVVNATQSNITQTGNLVSLTINDGSSSNTSVFQPTGTIVNSNTYVSVNQRDIANNSRDGIILANASVNKSYTLNYLPSTGNTIVTGPTMEVYVDDNIGVGNVAVPGSFTFTTYNSGSNLTSGDGNLRTSFSVGDAVTFFNGAPFSGNSALFSTFNYGMSSDPASSTLWRSTRRRGNGTTRLSLEPNDYLGNIEWRGARGGGALPTGSRFAKIAPRVDSSYVANTSTQPVGIEFWVTDNTTARSQIFHANGNVTFSDAVNANIVTANYLYGDGSNITGIAATNANYANFAGNAFSVDAANVSGLGNIATINLDGNASNLLDGTGNWVAIPTSGSANYANFAGEVVTNAQPNITSVGNLTALTVTGNLTSNAITWSNTITYNGSLASVDKIIVQADLPGNTIVRNLGIRGGNVSNALASNTVAGGVFINGGGATSTDAGNVWIARGAGTTFVSGTGNTANGNAFGGGGGFQAGTAITQLGIATGGGFSLIGGSAISNNGSATSGGLTMGSAIANSINGNATAGTITLGAMSTNANTGNASGGAININAANNRTITSGNATGGTINLNSGNARSENGSATSGNINLTTGPANANISGTATIGSINISTGTANGVTGNVSGNINIGTTNTSNAVNIGAANTPVNVAGNLIANISNVANTQLNRYQETTFAIGNVSGTITPDFNDGSIQSMTLTGNITLNSLGNAVAGRSMTLILTQDGTGGKTLTSSMLFAGASKTLSTAASAIDVISVFYDGTTYYASLSKGYA